jgi:hypothetical protein
MLGLNERTKFVVQKCTLFGGGYYAQALRSEVRIWTFDAGPVVNPGARHDCIHFHLQSSSSSHRVSGAIFAPLGSTPLAGELEGRR